MAGLYIHIPYCKQKCNYCNFFSKPVAEADLELFITTLCKEIDLRSQAVDVLSDSEFQEPIQSIYFGGGTPSLLGIAQLQRIFKHLYDHFSIADTAEITLEGNPESLSAAYIQSIQSDTPVNRLSIGVQSFQTADLQYLNRKHTVQQARTAIEKAYQYGLTNLSIDLIYGIPTLTDAAWAHNLREVADLNVTHLSAYALTIEPKTMLYRQIQKGLRQDIDENQQIRRYNALLDWADTHRFQHYEISNFCKEQRYSIHNCNYWNHTSYLGLGPSAHSLVGRRRTWHSSDIATYNAQIANEQGMLDYENLTPTMVYNESVMTALRTCWGIRFDTIEQQCGLSFSTHLKTQLATLPEAWIHTDIHGARCTREGMLFADRIASELFI
ncbi:coproporphyrinogen III oxidase [Bacteroidia bacterium]|nr:coproporphyrinogen III oxidase [Bacteroidia bacterium]